MAQDHYEIAVEQYVFWLYQGLTRHQMLLAVGQVDPPNNPSAEQTVLRLAAAHRLLTLRQRERAA